ncbi:uncharacterized protein LOC128232857 isoform X1 [Mya arenaria]|uniref:uncharacterized protein LOC128232857 isoform X1 n=1 Tax=Mya arenaria TaxID=6604 RepID=UPI0022E71CDE|nr:uncharacterized protein LOC128232857 isoform X1 [Mya arenaria]XP_052802590.1 uncharacterized protein LOC128232857 isoform X1 [Mya arenaria]XP_052802592.1 uncharacterized protein LOC128232857 isoform X1 [Mya arenaria]
MELKIWVDGIKRVVCGVTDNTTCQDIVIALAQAMGRTGRFTLIEQWRENERPLAPGESPLLVLQKWGEFANEVKFVLYESGTRKKQKNVEKEKQTQKPQDRFTHNFTPPVKTSEAMIRRSLTFSGGRKLDVDTKQGSTGHYLVTSVSDRVPSNGNLVSSNSSIVSQNSAFASDNRQRHRSSSHDRASSGRTARQPSPLTNPHPHPHDSSTRQSRHPNTDHHQTIPHSYAQSGQNHSQQQNKYPSEPSGLPSFNGPAKPNTSKSKPQHVHTTKKHSSAFIPVKPRVGGNDEILMHHQQPDIPVYTDIPKSSHVRNRMEEYDLNTNFPDVVKETGRDFLIEEYQMPGHHGNQAQWEEEERVKLLRLVTMQNERIKMQDSQLDIIHTEISSREQTIEDIKLEIEIMTSEIDKLTQESEGNQAEIETIDNGTLIDEIEAEKLAEKEIKNEIAALKSRLIKCEMDLEQFQKKVKTCSSELEREQEVLKSDEKRRQEEVLRLQSEISDLRKEVDNRTEENKERSKLYTNVNDELEKISEELTEKSEELTTTEKELQRENLKFFQPVVPTPGNPGEASGEAVLKVLEGGGATQLKVGLSGRRSRIVASPLTVLELTRKQNGVWV